MTIWQNQANLNKGELDPKLYGRTDTELYYGGLSAARNVLLTPQGGVKKRPGTRYLDNLNSLSGSAYKRQIRVFVDTYGNEYVAVFYLSIGLFASRFQVFKNGSVISNLGGSGNDYLTIPWNNSTYLPFTYIQSANVAIILAEGNEPKIITKDGSADNNWSISAISFTNVPQYDFGGTGTTETHLLAITNPNPSDVYRLSIDGFLSEDITWSANTAENEERIRIALQDMDNTGNSGITVAHSVGNSYTVNFTGESANSYGTIQAIAVTTQNTAFEGESSILVTGASGKEDAFSSTRGWPTCGVFHQNRLWLGSTERLPDALFGSVIGDYFNFDQGRARDDEGIFVQLQTEQVNNITAIVSARKLQVFTTGSEFYCPNDTITPATVRFDLSSNYGSEIGTMPVTLDGSVFFPQKDSTALINTGVSNQYQPIETRNIGVLAPHLLSGIGRMALSRGKADSDANYLYCVNSDGNIACLNLLAAEGVEGFSLWETADGTITDVCVSESSLYMIVLRDGEYYLEVEDDDYHVDSGVPISSASTVNLGHISGQTAEVIGDGYYKGEFTSSASTALGETIESGQAGLPFRPTVTTMPLNPQTGSGPYYARKKRIRRAILQLYQSNGVSVNGTVISDMQIGVNQFDPPTPFTGIKRVPLRGYSIEKTISVTQDTPFPFFLLSIGWELKI